MQPDTRRAAPRAPTGSLRLLQLAEAVMYVLLLALPMLRYANLRSSFYDLGQYISILHIAGETQQPGIAFSTHAQLYIPLYAVISRVFLNPYSLLALQSAACIAGYVLLKRILLAQGLKPWAVFALFFSSLPVWFTVLNDFHFEHLIWLLYPAFVILLMAKRKTSDTMLVLAALLLCFIKETYALSAAFMGVMAWFYGHKRAGATITIMALTYFFVVTVLLIPAFTAGMNTGELWRSAFGHLGKTPVDIARNVATNPLTILTSEVFTPRKLLFVAALFLPFAYVLRYAPLALLPALPSLLVLALSRNANHAYLGHHYTVMVTATLLGALALSTRAIADETLKNRLVALSAVVSFLVLVLFGPAPLVSRLFWSQHAWSYQASAYLPDARSRHIVELIEQHVPADPKVVVSAQGTINHVRIADRPVAFAFPLGVHEPARAFEMVADTGAPAPPTAGQTLATHRLRYAEFVLIDSKRPLTLDDTTCRWTPAEPCNEPDFAARVAAHVARMDQNFDKVVEFDGFAIYRRKQPRP